MSLPKHNQPGFVILVFAVILCFWVGPPASAQGSLPSPAPSVAATPQKLADEKTTEEINKLKEETTKLRLENKKLSSTWDSILSYGAFVTVLLALAGFAVTFWKQVSDNSRQRLVDCEQRDREHRQRADSARVRLEEQFNLIVTNLGSKSASIQASSAIQIMNFLKPEYRDFHNQVFLILYANLKVQLNKNIQNEVLAQLLVQAFQKALRIELQQENPNRMQAPIDLARAYLKRADLSKLDLSGADLAYAELQGANLTESKLVRVRGFEANLEKARLSRADLMEARLMTADLSGAQLHEANLVSAVLKNTNLTKAQFQKARLQSAHLEGANLTDAHFEQANLNDTFFKGATFSPATLKSIINAIDWEKAHFDAAVLVSLEKLDTDRSNKNPKE